MSDLADLLDRLDCSIEMNLARLAVTHRSFAYENGGLPTNERLEFLGDAVLGLVVTETLYRIHPDAPEGQLAKMRSAVVNARTLADVARHIGMGEYLLLGRGEITSGGRDKSSILADSMEAVIGAAYLDRGMAEAVRLVHRLFDPAIGAAATLGAGLDWKTSIQELSARRGLGTPRYVLEESGPDHEKTFAAVIVIGGSEYPPGIGRTKKEAEQEAAREAWQTLRGGGRDSSDGSVSVTRQVP